MDTHRRNKEISTESKGSQIAKARTQNHNNTINMSLASPQLLTGLGSAASIFFAATGSAIASAEGGIYALRKKGPQAFVPIIISGVLAIYGIIISILLVGKLEGPKELTTVDGYRNLSAGLSVGLACLASGLGIARFLNHLNKAAAGSDEPAETPESEPLLARSGRPHKENFIYLCMSLCFLEAIGLYGLIVGLFLVGK